MVNDSSKIEAFNMRIANERLKIYEEIKKALNDAVYEKRDEFPSI